jgi:hypothetical protein
MFNSVSVLALYPLPSHPLLTPRYLLSHSSNTPPPTLSYFLHVADTATQNVAGHSHLKCAHPKFMKTKHKWASGCAKSYYIFVICLFSHSARQLFHTLFSLLKHYLPLYHHFQLMTKISVSLRKLTIVRDLPNLPLSAYPPLLCKFSCHSGSSLCSYKATSVFHSIFHSHILTQRQVPAIPSPKLFKFLSILNHI